MTGCFYWRRQWETAGWSRREGAREVTWGYCWHTAIWFLLCQQDLSPNPIRCDLSASDGLWELYRSQSENQNCTLRHFTETPPLWDQRYVSTERKCLSVFSMQKHIDTILNFAVMPHFFRVFTLLYLVFTLLFSASPSVTNLSLCPLLLFLLSQLERHSFKHDSHKSNTPVRLEVTHDVIWIWMW